MSNVKLLRGDCLIRLQQLKANSVDLVVTDPPYKTTSRGNSGGTSGILGSKQFLSGNGGFELNDIEFSLWLPQVYRVLKPDSHCYIMSNNKCLHSLLDALRDSEFRICKTLIWAKNNCITNMWYMDSHEYIVFCYKGKARKIKNCGTRSVLHYPNVKNKVHPSEKPLDLIKCLILNSSEPQNIVLDPFMGSGSTGVSAIGAGRRFIGIEQDPEYFRVAKNRMRQAWEEQN